MRAGHQGWSLPSRSQPGHGRSSLAKLREHPVQAHKQVPNRAASGVNLSNPNEVESHV